VQRPRKVAAAQTERHHELLSKDFSGMHGWQSASFRISFLHTQTVRGLEPRRPTSPSPHSYAELDADRNILNTSGGARYCSRTPLIDAKPITDDEAFARHCRFLSVRPESMGTLMRIADFYAGLVGDFRSTQKWKRLRQAKHDHHPVHDALGNAEALIQIFAGER
jgi:hypothetical protein